MEYNLSDDSGIVYLPAPAGWGVAYSPVSKKLFVCSENPSQMTVFTVDDKRAYGYGFGYTRGRPVAGIDPNGPAPFFITCSPTDTRAYACMSDGSIMIVDTSGESATSTNDVPELDGELRNMAFSPDGSNSLFPVGGGLLYVASEPLTASNGYLKPLVSVDSHWVAVTKDGRFAYCGGRPGNTDAVLITQSDWAGGGPPGVTVKNLDDAVNTFDVTFDNNELLVATDAQIVDVVNIAQNSKIGSIDFGGSDLGQISCSRTAPRACLTLSRAGLVSLAVIDTIDNSVRGTIPIQSAAVCTCFDEYGNAYVSTATKGVMVIIYSKINSM